MLMRKRRRAKRNKSVSGHTISVGTRLTFRAEVMPGRDAIQRTYEVSEVLSSGRVHLATLDGQHSLAEFEPTQWKDTQPTAEVGIQNEA